MFAPMAAVLIFSPMLKAHCAVTRFDGRRHLFLWHSKPFSFSIKIKFGCGPGVPIGQKKPFPQLLSKRLESDAFVPSPHAYPEGHLKNGPLSNLAMYGNVS